MNKGRANLIATIVVSCLVLVAVGYMIHLGLKLTM
jgi:hypothetical protein